MKQVVWHDRYKLGIDFIDKEHKQLFSTVNKFMAISEEEGKSEWVCREGVKFLRNHSVEHFEHEEEYMRSIQYQDYEIHKRLHDDFRNKTLPALEQEMEDTRYSEESVRHFLAVCIGWVISHTLTEDMAIVGKTHSKWTDLSVEKEQEAVEQTVGQLIQDIFHIKGKVISEQYSGEDFGKVICCRFCYKNPEKQKWEIILVYEEELLLQIMEGILNSDYKKVDDMALNVIRYISRQFTEKVRESFPALAQFELDKESLLTHEQLLNVFERESPACSLLFDAGAGYFAFCEFKANSIHETIPSAINHQNAMDMVNQYLVNENKEWEEKKQKILVVDDSEFMRKKIVRLLEKDYSVLEADSSVSAIRCIALNRPNLILLDYEMPICDGRQALEMIRSEKSMANIPVFFLTSRGDRESVQKVMPLKPEGYLLKTMPEEAIKKQIDAFFEKQEQQ